MFLPFLHKSILVNGSAVVIYLDLWILGSFAVNSYGG